MYEENKALIEVIRKYATEENVGRLQALAEDLKALNVEQYAALLNSEEVRALVGDVRNTDFTKYQALVSNPLFSAFFTDLSALMQDAEKVLPQLQPIVNDVNDGKFKKLMDDAESMMPTFNALSQELSSGDAAKAVEQLPQTLETLTNLFNTIQQNRDVINTLSTVFSEENVQKLTQALQESDDISINTVLESVSGLTADPAATAARLRAIAQSAKTQKIFSDAPVDMQTSVTYIYQTPGVAAN